jgi:hypothetical protein
MYSREENGRKRVKLLQKQLGDIKKEKEKEIQERNEMIAHLKVNISLILQIKDPVCCK